MKPDPAGATSSSISLREYVEAKIEGEREIARVALAAARAESLASHKTMAAEFQTFKENLARQIAEAAHNIDGRLKLLNELRAEVIQDRSGFVTRDKYDAEMGARNARVELLERWQAKSDGLEGDLGKQDTRIQGLEAWRNKLLGIGIVVSLMAGLVGALLMRLLAGVFGGGP